MKFAKKMNPWLRSPHLTSHHLTLHHLSHRKTVLCKFLLRSPFEMADRADESECNYETQGSWEVEDCLDKVEKEFKIAKVEPLERTSLNAPDDGRVARSRMFYKTQQKQIHIEPKREVDYSTCFCRNHFMSVLDSGRTRT